MLREPELDRRVAKSHPYGCFLSRDVLHELVVDELKAKAADMARDLQAREVVELRLQVSKQAAQQAAA
jgi:hypothetical protein